MADLVLQIIAFLGGFTLIILGVDWFMDNAREVIEKRKISPYIVGAILFDVDVEEIIASIAAAVLGYPTVAVGNAIGNNTISLTLPLAITGTAKCPSFRRSPETSPCS